MTVETNFNRFAMQNNCVPIKKVSHINISNKFHRFKLYQANIISFKVLVGKYYAQSSGSNFTPGSS